MSFTSYRERINSYLKKQLHQSSTNDSILKQSMAYSLLSGGKRLRPMLAYATAESLEIDLCIADSIAAAIEMIHAYSLIHDDLPAMDNDDLRRGKATNHIAFDEATAILAGDALQALAFETLASGPIPADITVLLIKQLAQASGVSGMAGGQSLDLLSENKSINLAALKLIHVNKTGAILKSSITMVTEAASNLNISVKNHYQNFAEHLGVAFQIVDDILDITQDTQTLGKPAHSDDRNNKATYPSLLGLNGAQKQADQHIAAAYQHLSSIPLDTSLLESLTDLILKRTH